jgi:hypothetical protein
MLEEKFDHCPLTGFRFYNAHETTAVEEFAVALLCGDVRCDVSKTFSQTECVTDLSLDVCWRFHP